jgi:hypothetical protein
VPVKVAVGPWNFVEVSPQQLLGRFNGFLKSVICRVSEARDLGDIDRHTFYDHLKATLPHHQMCCALMKKILKNIRSRTSSG